MPKIKRSRLKKVDMLQIPPCKCGETPLAVVGRREAVAVITIQCDSCHTEFVFVSRRGKLALSRKLD
jgi:hypothetical protein